MILRGATFFAGVVIMALGPAWAWAEILIATAGPMTGQYTWLGEQSARGAEMAVDDINAAQAHAGPKAMITTPAKNVAPRRIITSLSHQLVQV